MAIVTKTIGTAAGAAGTGTVTASGTAVTGSGTSFTTEITLPEYIVVAGVPYQVASVTDNTNLTLQTSLTASAASFNIGTRDYSTITAWEADLDDSGIYSASDDAVGECYADSDFDEAVTIDGGGTVSLTSATLSVETSERHDGSGGTGVRILRTGSGSVITVAVSNVTVEWLEIDGAGNATSTSGGLIKVSSGDPIIKNNLLHDALCNAGAGIWESNADCHILNNTIYDIIADATGSADVFGIGGTGGSARLFDWHNNTVFNTTNNNGSGNSYGLRPGTQASGKAIKNNLILDSGGTTSGAKADFDDITGGTIDDATNISSDTTGNIVSKASTDQFVSTTGGSEDLHLKAGSDAIGAGTDLATTANIDINGTDRDYFDGNHWDIGAHQYRLTASLGTAKDYTDLSTWEAGLGDAVYDQVSEIYCEVFGEVTGSGVVTINSGRSIPIVVTAGAGERHTGIAGSGARLTNSTNHGILLIGQHLVTIEWLELFATGTLGTGNQGAVYVTSGYDNITVQNNVIYGFVAKNSYNSVYGVSFGSTGQSDCVIQNNIIYDIDQPGASTGSSVGINVVGNGATNQVLNNTVHSITNAGGTLAGVVNVAANVLVKNTISTDSDGDSFTGGTQTYNISSDTTASGTGSLTSRTSANLFASNTGGSEDLHLKAGSDAIGAGTDLATTPAGVNIDINGSNRNSFAATTWDIGAHQFELVASIGATGRDYSTMTLWEADLDDDTIYGAGARARGEMYKDAPFAEGATVTIDGGSSLAYATLTAADGEQHDGTEGTGVVSTDKIYVNRKDFDLEWLEVDGDRITGESTDANIRRCITHGWSTTGSTQDPGGFQFNLTLATDLIATMMDCLSYDHVNSGAGGRKMRGFSLGANGRWASAYNCVAHDISSVNASSNGHDFYAYGSTGEIKNCISTADGTTNAQDGFYFRAGSTVHDYNASVDTTATGANSLNAIVSSTEFVSNTSPYDLHLKSGADCIDAGVDLVTTPTGVNIDIDGRDRDAEGDVWDIGAHEFVSVGGVATPKGVFGLPFFGPFKGPIS